MVSKVYLTMKFHGKLLNGKYVIVVIIKVQIIFGPAQLNVLLFGRESAPLSSAGDLCARRFTSGDGLLIHNKIKTNREDK